MIRYETTPRTLAEIRANVQAMRQAMGWLFRLRDKSISEEDLANWTYWYESEGRNKSAFDQVQEFWIGAGALGSGPEGRSRIGRLLESRDGQSRNRPSPRPQRRLTLALAASVAAPLLIGAFVLSWHLLPSRQGAREISRSVPLVRTTFLPDGSKVELAPQSFMSVRYTPTERWISLKGGEAFFNVVHNPRWPFVVSVNDIEVRDVGTTFNVRDADRRTVVMVATGAVDVYSATSTAPPDGARATISSIRITAGHEVKWDEGSRPVVGEASTQRTLAWRQGRLDYIDEPLSAVIADVDRYLTHPVHVRDRSVGDIAFTGTVLTKSASEWVRALPSEFPVKIVSEGEDSRLILIAAPPHASPR